MLHIELREESNMATETKATPKATTFSIKGPYLSEGRVNIDLARTDLLWLSLKINAEGGENAVHTHMNEDHSFIVLEGEVTFFDEHGTGTVCQQYEGIMIPRGAFYRYLNTGDRNLFLLRMGARINADASQDSRLKPDGSSIHSDTAENFHVDGVEIPGKSFGA
jgi:oxalate decarboxylase/phosphoglucose isomerase-like protein (cupin superfamily)